MKSKGVGRGFCGKGPQPDMVRQVNDENGDRKIITCPCGATFTVDIELSETDWRRCFICGREWMNRP